MGNDLFFIVKIIDIVRKIFLTDGENIMQCPHCNVTLMMADRQGIEIDYCPQCRGVWLDRGELDKIIERTAAESAPVQSARPATEGYREPQRDSYREPQRDPYREPQRDRGYGDGRGYGHSDHHGKYRKKKSLLGELFDF